MIGEVCPQREVCNFTGRWSCEIYFFKWNLHGLIIHKKKKKINNIHLHFGVNVMVLTLICYHEKI